MVDVDDLYLCWKENPLSMISQTDGELIKVCSRKEANEWLYSQKDSWWYSHCIQPLNIKIKNG